MRHLRTGIIIVIVAVILFFIGSAIRSYYLFLKEPVAPVTDALPANTSVIISTKSVFRLFESINNSALADLLDSKQNYYPLVNAYLDTIELKHKAIYDLTKNAEVVFALTGEQGNSFILGVTVGKTGVNKINDKIRDLLKNKGLTVSAGNDGIYSVTGNTEVFWYYVRKGLFVMSPDSSAVIASFNTLMSEKSLNSDPAFKKLRLATGKSSDANILINNQAFGRIIWPEKVSWLTRGTPFDGWSAFDITIKKGEVTLGGFTYSSSDNILKGQQPVSYTGYLHFPATTAFAFSIALSDQQAYISNFIKSDTLHVEGFDASIKQKTVEIFKPQQHINAWIGNSVSLITTKNFFPGNRSEQMVIIESKDRDSASAYLRPLIEPLNDSIGKLHYATLCEDLWGPAFKLPGELYCLISTQKVVISPSLNLLKSSSSGMKNDKLSKLQETAGDNSNIFIYLEPQYISNWIKGKSKERNTSLIDFLSGNRAIGFEYNAGNELQYTHAWLTLPPAKDHKKTPEQELTADTSPVKDENKDANTEALTEKSEQSATDKTGKAATESGGETASEKTAKVKIEKTVRAEQSGVIKEIKLKSGSNSPQILTGKTRNEKRIAVLTKKGFLSMYDHTGELLWVFDCKEKAFDNILEADFNRNGKVNYMVTTPGKIYVLDTEGKQIKGSPVRLPATAAGRLSIVDYENNRDYRILYVGENKKIYNITLKGKELPDWQKPEVTGFGSITFIRTGGRDYLVYQDQDKAFKVYDRRGKERLNVNKGFTLSPRTRLFSNKTNSKGIFLTVTSLGEMVYINEKGIISKSSFGRFGTGTWFNYTDFDSDGTMDFIFAKNNRIVAYTKMKNVIADRVLKKGNFGTPFIYPASSREKWIFARNSNNNEVIGFNNKGKSYPSKLESDTDPIIFNPGGSFKEIIITTVGDKLILNELEGL